MTTAPAAAGVDQEVASLRSANQPQEPKPSRDAEVRLVRPIARPVHGFAGADWLKSNLRYVKGAAQPSWFGEIVADILGFVYGGLYHLPNTNVEKPNWSSERHVAVSVPDGIATWDGSQLTYLVLLAHACAVRLEISAGGPHRLKLHFSPRDRDGTIMRGHPTVEQAVAALATRCVITPVVRAAVEDES